MENALLRAAAAYDLALTRYARRPGYRRGAALDARRVRYNAAAGRGGAAGPAGPARAARAYRAAYGTLTR